VHAGGVTCNYTIEAWGSGKWRFSATANNGDFEDANYAIAFWFGFSSGGGVAGAATSGQASLISSDNFDQQGSSQWLLDNWPWAFASDVKTDLTVSESLLSGIGLVVDVVGAILVPGTFLFPFEWRSLGKG